LKDDSVFIRHMLVEVDYILFSIKDKDFNSLMSDETHKRAVIRSLEIIGEAAKKISHEFKEKYPQVEWKGMAGLRDKLIHFYFGVDWDIVWDIIDKEIPLLKKQLDVIISEIG